MKKIFMSLMAAMMFVGLTHGASSVSSWSTVQLVAEINEALANPVSSSLTVNGGSVDINMTGTNNIIDITQTNVAGKTDVPLMRITDARTGGDADAPAEAALWIDAAGAYAAAFVDGIVAIEGEIDSPGDITLDPAGGDVIIDGATDADSYTANAGSGIDTKSTGALDIGNTTATSIDYGNTNITAHTFTSDGVGTAEFVVPNASIGATEVALTEDQMLFGDGGTGVAAVVSGDIKIPKTGIAAIQPLAVTAGDIVLTEGQILIGDGGTGTAVVISGDIDLPDTGIAVVTQLNSIAVATVTAGAAAGATATQPADVYGESTITGAVGAAAQLFMTNAIQTVAGDGSTPITDYAVIRAWVSETDNGVASTNNIEALTLSDGSAIETKTANADYIYLTGSVGEATVVIEGTASSLTNYLMISIGPQVNSKAIIFVTP